MDIDTKSELERMPPADLRVRIRSAESQRYAARMLLDEMGFRGLSTVEIGMHRRDASPLVAAAIDRYLTLCDRCKLANAVAVERAIL